jgi:hypothetical protein
MRALFPFLLLAAPLAAQEAALLPASLPPEVAEAILARPDRFAAMATDLIHGHGTGGTITPAVIETAIALDRAFFRTRALRPFLESDLDADGTLTTPEVTARAVTLSPPARARLMRDHAAADADADGTLSPPELRAHAEAGVARASRPLDEGLMRAVAAFDADADGQTGLAELTRALQPLSATD